ncbi:MAG: DNA polymerase III subunit delta [Nitrospirae bacterium]|nr:DNA polymerase III subunit delta [Nitrospirota bacterium]
MSIKLLINERDSGYKSPAYIIACTDDFLYSEAMNVIRGGGDGGDGQIVDVFDIADTSQSVPINSIIDLLNTVSLFSQRQIVVIRNFQKAGKDKIELIIKYLTNPSLNSVLFIMHKKVKDKSNKSKNSAVIESLITPSKKNAKVSLELPVIDLDIARKDVLAWVAGKAARLGISISNPAITFMNEIYGDNLGMLSNEIEKLSLLGKKKLALEDVLETSYGEKEGNTFHLTDVIAKLDTKKALNALRLVIAKTDPLMLLGAINWKLSTIHDKRLAQCFEILIDTEMRLKGSNPDLPMDWTVLRLIQMLR